MVWESFKITGIAVVQIFLLGAIGYFLIKKEILTSIGVDILSRLIVEVTLPILIFCQLIKDFRFNLYPNWWIFPVLSILITLIGLSIGYLFAGLIKGYQHKQQFLSLIAFQNAGYLPLALTATLLTEDKSNTMFIYLFLFLLGFNLLVWSLGVYMLSSQENKRFELGSLFSPPVIAVSFTLIIIFLGLNKFIPQATLKPLRMIGDCTLPLAMLVTGGSLGLIQLKQINKKTMGLMLLAKLIILPALGLWILIKFKLPELIGLLIIIELAVPPATSLSVITRHYKKEDLLISHGVFVGHLASIISLPVFLSLYFALSMIK